MKKILVLILTFFSLHMHAQFVEAEQCIGGRGQDEIFIVKETPDSGLLMFANTYSNNGDFADCHGTEDIGLIKFNKNREIEWKKCFGDTLGTEVISGYAEYGTNMYLLTYSIRPSFYDTIIGFNPGMSRVVLTAINKDGNILWQGYPYGITPSPSTDPPNIAMTMDSLNGDVYIYLPNNVVKFDASGIKRWEQNFDILTTVLCDFGNCITNNWVLPLNHKEALLCTFISPTPFFGYPPYVIFSRLDSNGVEIVRSDTMQYNLWDNMVMERSKNDDSISFYAGGFATYAISLNLHSMAVLEGTTTGGYEYYMEMYERKMGWSSNNNIFKMLGDGYYFATSYVYDSTISADKIFVDIRNMNTGVVHSIPSDSLPSYILSFYYCTKDSSLLYIYPRDGYIYMLKYRLDATLVYDLPVYNLQGDSVSYYWNKAFFGKIYNNKLYENFFVDDKVTQANKYQVFQILNTDNGHIENQFINDFSDSFTFKHISPLGGKDLFVVADFIGTHRCHLGAKDIAVSKVLMNANRILGKAFIDYNNNQSQDAGDPTYGLAYLQSIRDSSTISTYMFGNNYTVNYVDTGAWQTRVVPHHTYFSITPATLNTAHSGFGFDDTLLFSLYPTQTIKDLKISLINPFVTRPGTNAAYEITYANEGTHTANGTVKLLLDGRVSYLSSVPAITIVSGDTLVWNFSNLLANESRKIVVQFTVPVPPVLNAGDILSSTAFVEPVANDSTPADNSATLKEVVRTSYDPNDKVTTSGEEMTTTQIQNGDYITYVVRFQNTGNDTAFRVVVLDTLDDKLDWSSLQPLNASHPFLMQVIQNHIIQFTFAPVILTPATVNEPLSHGFIAYKIRAKESVTQGAIIKNTAHIYFDFNTPVNTSTVNTRITLLTSVHPDIKNDLLKIYPNPNSGIFSVGYAGNEALRFISITDITGREVYHKNISSSEKNISVDLHDAAGGLYTISLKTEAAQYIQKILLTQEP